MGYRFLRQYSNFTGIGSGNTVTQQLPAFGTYYTIVLTPLTGAGALLTDAQVAADISRVRVLAEGNELCNISGRDLILLNNAYQSAYSNATSFVGDLRVPFVKPNWPTDQQQTVVGLGTQDINSLTVEVTCGGGALTMAQLQLRAEQDDTIAPLGQHLRLTTLPFTFGTTGLQDISTLPDESMVAVLGYHIVHSNATACAISEAALFINGSERTRARRSNLISGAIANRRTPQAPGVGSTAAFTGVDFLTLDFNPSNDVVTNFALAPVQEQRLQLTWTGSAPGNFSIIREAVFGVPVPQNR